MRLIADLFLLLGACFVFLGALGLIRMPDVYNRIQAGTKAVTLGAIAIFIGIGFLFPQWWAKLLVIMGFILLTNPVSSSAIARAFFASGVKPWHRMGTPTIASSDYFAEASEQAPKSDTATANSADANNADINKETSK
ncbi:monovalent cation/H(+) antiporter subunit G [sulfur-oxidizing endosymbiont of Gigantopelta aegis]|uniref:monovalent cation/H(+) antiporter subunit G n=1 Tax=sulfur-oxidizing endosymbiont of Gigantopelta aegis TaxID=2794934 RepID=UPI0018DCC85E